MLLLLLCLCVEYAFGGKHSFTLNLSWKTGAPDGFEREMIFINGGFPGPTLRVHQGDEVEVLVENNLPTDTTIHFHGAKLLKVILLFQVLADSIYRN